MKTDRHVLITHTGLAESVGLSYRLSEADFDGTRSFHTNSARKLKRKPPGAAGEACRGEQQRHLQATLRYYTFSGYLASSVCRGQG